MNESSLTNLHGEPVATNSNTYKTPQLVVTTLACCAENCKKEHTFTRVRQRATSTCIDDKSPRQHALSSFSTETSTGTMFYDHNTTQTVDVPPQPSARPILSHTRSHFIPTIFGLNNSVEKLRCSTHHRQRLPADHASLPL